MSVKPNELYASVFAIVEHLGGMELSDTSRNLIVAYLQESRADTTALKARAAILRYLPGELPTLEEIRERHKHGPLTNLDHLVLKMEYAAAQVH